MSHIDAKNWVSKKMAKLIWSERAIADVEDIYD